MAATIPADKDATTMKAEAKETTASVNVQENGNCNGASNGNAIIELPSTGVDATPVIAESATPAIAENATEEPVAGPSAPKNM